MASKKRRAVDADLDIYHEYRPRKKQKKSKILRLRDWNPNSGVDIPKNLEGLIYCPTNKCNIHHTFYYVQKKQD